jgi:hypothetical protein
MQGERIDLETLAQREHAIAHAEYIKELSAVARTLGNGDLEGDDLARAQSAKLRLENAYALLQFARSAAEQTH